MGTLGDIYDAIVRPISLSEVARAASMHDTEKLASVLERSATAARATASYLDDAEASQALIEGAYALDEISKGLRAGRKFHKDFKALSGIYSAWNDIDGGMVRSNPQRAARAFGRLFAHTGTLASYLPPPLDSYAEFLSGFEDFFENMRDKMDPESPNTPRGRMLRQVMRM